jgi:hypothetical protein
MFEIAVSGFGPNIRLEFRDGGPIAACLKELTVYEYPSPDGGSGKEVWKIAAIGRCITLTGIDIGHLPGGFTEKADLLPLKMGARYQAFASAEKEYPDDGASSHWFVCRRAPQDAGWIDEHRMRELPTSCLR